jgi:hypothetical protein
MMVRVSDATEGLGVTIFGLSTCGDSLSGELGCSTSNNDPQQFFFATKAGEQTTTIAVEANTAIVPGAKFSIEGYFNQALTGVATDSCTPAPAAIAIPVSNATNPELTDKLVTGTTTGSGGDFEVTAVGKDCVGVSAEAGEDEVLAVTPQANGTLAVFVERAQGDAKYVPVVSITQDCNGASVACAAGKADVPSVSTFLTVTGGQTYHVVVDSLDGATSGQYLATVFLIPTQGAVIAREPSKYRNGSRHVVRDPAGKVLRVIDRANQ